MFLLHVSVKLRKNHLVSKQENSLESKLLVKTLSLLQNTNKPLVSMAESLSIKMILAYFCQKMDLVRCLLMLKHAIKVVILMLIKQLSKQLKKTKRVFGVRISQTKLDKPSQLKIQITKLKILQKDGKKKPQKVQLRHILVVYTKFIYQNSTLQ